MTAAVATMPTLPSSPQQTLPTTILEEVAASQEHLRTRLAGALDKPPPGVSYDSLPSVPLIDIGRTFTSDASAKEAVAQQIRSACLTTGFFQISNHGVTTSAISGVLEQARRFFHELSPEARERINVRQSPLFRGYEPPDFSYVNPDDMGRAGGFRHQPETKEGFNWGYEEALDPSGGDGSYVELDGSSPKVTGLGNLWPMEEELPGFYDAIREYYAQVLSLGRHLFRLFALSLGLEEGYFDDVVTHPGGIARLLYYKGVPALENGNTNGNNDDNDPINNGDLGLGAHTDYECFTMLLSSSHPGLEILFPPSPATNNKPIWIPCPIRAGTFTINVADFLQRWTNGLYKSTVHRVVSRPGGGERYSVPFFFSINYDADVERLPGEVVGESKWERMKAGEYVLERLRATAS
jgi:isopenicillin N synthase-like dioxygenase